MRLTRWRVAPANSADQPLARGFLQLVERFQAKRLGELVVDRGVACGASIRVAVVSNSAGWPASFSLA